MHFRAVVCAVIGLVFLVLLVPAAESPAATLTSAAFAWTPCPIDKLPTRECAELIVPLDYNEPEAR